VEVDNTITYGLGSACATRTRASSGWLAGGQAFSVNGDDGNQNYDTGISRTR